MTASQMHYEFKIGLDKIDSLAYPNLIAEEIDVFLNSAVDEFISQRAYGNNIRKQGIEETQKRLDDLRNITKSYNTTTFINTPNNKPNGVFVNLPSDYRHALQEDCTISYTDCHNQTVSDIGKVIPITHDRYNKIIKDPFNKPTNDKILRLAYEGDTFELISTANSTITNYSLRYLRKPAVITNGPSYQTPVAMINCDLSESTHREIIKLAIIRALSNIESPRVEIARREFLEME